MNFFDTKKFLIRREVLKRFLENDPSKQTTDVEKTSYLRFLCRDSEKVPRGTHLQKPLELDSSILTLNSRRTTTLIYNYLFVVIFTPTKQSIAKEHT